MNVRLRAYESLLSRAVAINARFLRQIKGQSYIFVIQPFNKFMIEWSATI